MFSIFKLKKSRSAKNEDDPKKLWFILNFGFNGLFVTTDFTVFLRGVWGALPVILHFGFVVL